MLLRDGTEEDLPALLEIHNDAVRTLKAIWTDRQETLESRRDWFRSRKSAGLPVIVAEDESGQVVGYGSFGPYREKEGYRLTVEHSVYVLPQARGLGAGRLLLERLIELARGQGYHVLVAAIDGENGGSIALHEKCGFKVVGRLPQVGMKFGDWLDLVLMTLVLDDHANPPAGH
ncbi:N-acetyltransferase [Labrenzia suaedae]|uniref:N-acetyltransferase n=2 Tax=Roseibium litorale TaxID=2803841 RepID=A0ABR9CNS1_9HYPH|nr:N-acetyltransferase [Roseibium litorale]